MAPVQLVPSAAPHAAFSVRSATVDDAVECHRLSSDADAAINGNYPLYGSPHAWYERLRIAADRSSGQTWLVAEADEGVLLGLVSLTMNLSDYCRRHVAELGICIDAAHRGEGVGSALMQAAIDYAERWLAATRIELFVWADNAVARKLYRKFGFMEEGLLRAYGFRNGRYADAVVTARIHARPA